MAEGYRIEKGAEDWKYKAYDYVRTDAFCCGQNIPVEFEFSQDDDRDEMKAIILVEDHKPIAGCRIAFPKENVGKIERVCVVREKQKEGYGRQLIGLAEDWLREHGIHHIVINSQDRAAGFYSKLGYKVSPEESAQPKKKNPFGFSCVLVEKYV